MPFVGPLFALNAAKEEAGVGGQSRTIDPGCTSLGRRTRADLRTHSVCAVAQDRSARARAQGVAMPRQLSKRRLELLRRPLVRWLLFPQGPVGAPLRWP